MNSEKKLKIFTEKKLKSENNAGRNACRFKYVPTHFLVWACEKGVRHDLIAAVFEQGGEDDLVRLLAKVDALAEFLASEDGAHINGEEIRVDGGTLA